MSNSNNDSSKHDSKTKKDATVSVPEEETFVFDPEKSPLVAHARRELDLAGISDEDSDYGGMLAKAALELIETFAAQRHSGTSAPITIEIFSRLAHFEALSPLTSDPEEWQSVSKESGYPLWQSKRAPAHFSKDGGKTWYNVDTNEKGRSKTPKEIEDAKKKAAQEKPKADK